MYLYFPPSILLLVTLDFVHLFIYYFVFFEKEGRKSVCNSRATSPSKVVRRPKENWSSVTLKVSENGAISSLGTEFVSFNPSYCPVFCCRCLISRYLVSSIFLKIQKISSLRFVRFVRQLLVSTLMIIILSF